ncbi:MAG: polyprenyl synthetase family protein [Actinomycetota bacterium]|nr:polyprenyl synthetase family protein [Actinomycetota bacterium]
MTSFWPGIDLLRAQIDARLRDFLMARRRELEEAGDLIDEIARVIESGGKRLRPAFCYWGYRGAGGEHSDDIVRAAASLELLHTFAIVHDDIMDASEERRGVPTSFAKHGVNVALLVGDLALVLADEAIMASGFDARTLAIAFEAYSRMRQEVIAGQYLDLKAAGKPSITEDEARRVALLKSGRYSIQEPLAIGASLAGAPAGLRRRLSDFGEPLGEAFQQRDDLLGTFGDPASLGKPIDSDIREGKHHVLYAKALAGLHGADRRTLQGLWGGGDALSDEDVRRLRSLIEVSGARKGTEVLLQSLAASALERLDALPIGHDARTALRELALEATDRQS